MGSCKSLHDGETNLIEAVSQLVNLVCIIVVGDNGQCTGQDTEGSINQSLGNTLRQSHGVG